MTRRVTHSILRATAGALLLLAARAHAEPPPPVELPSRVEIPARSDGPSTLGLVFGGFAVAGISTGATAGFFALEQKAIAEDHCSATVQVCDEAGRTAIDQGTRMRNFSTAGWIVGGVSLALSLYFLLSQGSSTPRDVGTAASGHPSTTRFPLVTHF